MIFIKKKRKSWTFVQVLDLEDGLIHLGVLLSSKIKISKR